MDSNNIPNNMDYELSFNEDIKIYLEEHPIKREDKTIEGHEIHEQIKVENISEGRSSLQHSFYPKPSYQGVVNQNFQGARFPENIHIKQEHDYVEQGELDVGWIKNENKSEDGWCQDNEEQETNALTDGGQDTDEFRMDSKEIFYNMDCKSLFNEGLKDVEEHSIKREDMTKEGHVIHEEIKEENISEGRSSFQSSFCPKLSYHGVVNQDFQGVRSCNNIRIEQEHEQGELDVGWIKSENRSEDGWCQQDEEQETNEITAELDRKSFIFKKHEADEFESENISLNATELDGIKCEVSGYRSRETTSKWGSDWVQNNEAERGSWDSTFKCALSDYSTNSKRNLRRHIKMKHDSKNDKNSEMFKCTLCKYATKLKFILNQHIRRKHNENSEIFKCQDCEYTTRWKGSLKNHSKAIHDVNSKIFRCKFCEYTTRWKGCLMTHINAKHDVNSETFECNLCGFTTKVKSQLKTHLKMKHDENCQIFQCEFCEYTTKRKDCLKTHIKMMHDKNCDVFKCQFCEYITKWKVSLTNHTKAKHDVNSETFKCTLCGFTTKWRSQLKKHFRIKHDENCQIFECKFCEYKSKRRDDFKMHIKAKHDENSEMFKCTLCEYMTKLKTNLKQHIKVRHDENSEIFKCGFCEYTTKTKGNLKKHIKTKHNNNCSLCEYVTDTKKQLKQHIKIEHDENSEIFKCPFCEFTTKTKSYLKTHVKGKHDKNC